jgi:hypothetical protein
MELHRMKARFVVVIAGCAVLGIVACSEYQPGKYEGGGRTGGPVIIGGVGSGCGPIGAECQSSDDCCSHDCEFTGQVLTCAPGADSGTTCTANGGGCSGDNECCSSFCSAAAVCGNTPVVDSGGGG